MRIGPEADDDGLFPVDGNRFIFCFISAVKIRRGGIKFRRARINHFVNGFDFPFLPHFPDLFRQPVGECADHFIGETALFGLPQEIGGQRL